MAASKQAGGKGKPAGVGPGPRARTRRGAGRRGDVDADDLDAARRPRRGAWRPGPQPDVEDPITGREPERLDQEGHLLLRALGERVPQVGARGVGGDGLEPATVPDPARRPAAHRAARRPAAQRSATARRPTAKLATTKQTLSAAPPANTAPGPRAA